MTMAEDTTTDECFTILLALRDLRQAATRCPEETFISLDKYHPLPEMLDHALIAWADAAGREQNDESEQVVAVAWSVLLDVSRAVEAQTVALLEDGIRILNAWNEHADGLSLGSEEVGA